MEQENNSRIQIYIQTLGGFSISIGSHTINSLSQQSKKPWVTLAYLITFRNRDISSTELIEAIWGDDSGANPGSSLKTLLFRSRKLLEPLDISPQRLILNQGGSYAWTKEMDTITDADQFEHLCKTAFLQTEDAQVRKAVGLQAAELYKGDFLPQSAWEPWVIPIHTYYHNLYLKLIHQLLDTCFSEQSYQLVISLCRQAIAVENFDEALHYYLIYSLYKTGNARTAMEHYHRTTDMFYNEFAITPSDRLKDLYKLIQEDTHQIMTDLTAIQTVLQKNSPQSGAFFCEYTVFKDIYQLESRAIERTGDSIYLCLVTITNENRNVLPTTLLPLAMEKLRISILASLRSGDVFSRYSTNQYILLLPSATCENGEKVLKRILHHYKEAYPKKGVLASYSLQAILPFVKEYEPESEEQK